MCGVLRCGWPAKPEAVPAQVVAEDDEDVGRPGVSTTLRVPRQAEATMSAAAMEAKMTARRFMVTHYRCLSFRLKPEATECRSCREEDR